MKTIKFTIAAIILGFALAPFSSLNAKETAKTATRQVPRETTKKWEASVLVGPPTLGSGGSNPIGIPPVSAAEYELTLTTKSRWHFRLGLTPHIAAAGRMFKLKYGFETAVGASIVNSLHGYGPGIFSVFGWSSPCAFKRLCFSAQYIQDVGLSLTQWQITAPFAVRMGLVWKL